MENNKSLHFSGMQTFTLIWLGQFLSVMGTATTRFALIIWAYTQAGTATTTALLGFFSYMPYVLICPFAGVIVDRFDRKKILILSDLGAGLMTFLLLILFLTGNLQVWHLFLAEAAASAFEAFQIPAYSSTVSMLISEEDYTKANGMRSFSNYSSSVLAPILGGILVATLGISGILIIDISTFLIAMGTLLLVIIPKPDSVLEKVVVKRSFWSDFTEGLSYLKKYSGLIHLMWLYVGMNFFASLTYFGILPAMILARSGSSEITLASVQSAIGIGGIIGSLIVSTRPSPKNRAKTIVISGICSFFFGDLLLALGQNISIWGIGAFLSSLFLPFMSSAYESLWQSKIEPHFQGRIFSIRDMLQMACMPLGFIMGGLLADFIFEPAMSQNGYLTPYFSWLLGSGKGSGMAFMFLLTCILGTSICGLSYFNKELVQLDNQKIEI